MRPDGYDSSTETNVRRSPLLSPARLQTDPGRLSPPSVFETKLKVPSARPRVAPATRPPPPSPQIAAHTQFVLKEAANVKGRPRPCGAGGAGQKVLKRSTIKGGRGFTSPYSAKRNVNVPAVNFGVRGEEGKRPRDESCHTSPWNSIKRRFFGNARDNNFR